MRFISYKYVLAAIFITAALFAGKTYSASAESSKEKTMTLNVLELNKQNVIGVTFYLIAKVQ